MKITYQQALIDSNLSDLQNILFKKEFNSNLFYIHDHLVKKNQMLPGAGHIEMAYQAGKSAMKQPVTMVTDIVWMRPIIVKENQSLPVFISLLPSKNDASTFTFKIFSKENNQASIFSEGRLSFAPVNTELNKLDIQAIRQRCSQIIEKEQIYQRFIEYGFDYIGSFQSSKRFYINDHEILQELELAHVLNESAHEFALNPSLLDGVLRTYMGLYLAKNQYSPFAHTLFFG